MWHAKACPTLQRTLGHPPVVRWYSSRILLGIVLKLNMCMYSKRNRTRRGDTLEYLVAKFQADCKTALTPLATLARPKLEGRGA